MALVILLVGTLSLGQQGGAGSAAPGVAGAAVAPGRDPVNVNAVAILRWYPANLTTAFGAGTLSFLIDVVFDGASIWVTNAGTGSVTRFRASDGAVAGTFGVPAGARRLAFDGANPRVPHGLPAPP